MAKFDPSKAKNASMIKNMQEKASEQANARTVIDVDINLIDENPDNNEIFKMDDVQRLAYTIKTDGFWGVIEVFKKPDGRYQISSGHQRVAALRALGWEKAPVIVKSMPGKDVEVRRKLILSNIVGRNITPMELAKCVKYHKETLIMEAMAEKGIADYDERTISTEINMAQIYELLAQTFGKNSRTIRYLEDLNLLIPKLVELIDNETVAWSILATKGVPKMTEDVQMKIYIELMEVARGSYKDLENSTLTRKQIEESVARVCARLIEEEELEKIRAQSREVKTEKVVSEDVVKQQLVDSLKVQKQPIKKSVPAKQVFIPEEEALDMEKVEIPAPIAVQPKRNADVILGAVSSQLKSLLKTDFGFADEVEVYKSVSSIEESIKIIKEKLL